MIIICYCLFKAQHYLDTTRSIDELYHEQYKSVAVMFASVVDFELDKDDIDTDVSAATIKIMNTVISEFDKVSIRMILLCRMFVSLPNSFFSKN